MKERNEERVIYLKDLIFAVLYQWKKLLIIAVALAVLLGGFQLVTGIVNLNDPDTLAEVKRQNEIQQERYEAEVSSLKLQIETLRGQIRNQQEYLENSLLMQLEPYGYYEATLSVYIETDYLIQPEMAYQNPNKTQAIIRSYEALLLGNECLQAISDAMGTEPQYLKELLNMGTSVHSNNTDANIFSIVAKAPTEAEAQQLLDLLLEQIKLQQQSISASVGNHRCNVVEKATRSAIDLQLAEQQKAENDRLTTLLTAQSNAQTAQGTLKAPVMQGASFGAVAKKTAIFAVVGGVIGVFLSVVVIWICHIASSKVYSGRTLVNRTGIKVLGALNVDTVTNPIDKKLRIWEGRELSDPQVQTALLALRIRNHCNGVAKLLLTGSAVSEDLYQALGQAIPGVQIEKVGDILVDATALEALAECDAVVLTEQCHISHYQDVDRRMELIRDHNKQLLGCVLYGG